MNLQDIHSHFDSHGYVVVQDLLDPHQDLQPLVDDYAALLDEVTEHYSREGRLTSDYRELEFSPRYVMLLQEMGPGVFQHFDITLPQSRVTETTPIHLSEPVFKLLTNPRLLDVVESFIGPEIFISPVQHARIKPPEDLVSQLQNPMVNRTAWHQDQGVILPEADDSLILTVWLPVFDATIENGCLTVVPGSHRDDLLTHCPGGQVHIPENIISGLEPDSLPLPMQAGDVLIMHRRTVHSSLPNHSNAIRWSFDLRYQPIGTPSGRPAFPGFVGRSKEHPESVLTDYRAWAQLWFDTRSRLAEQAKPSFNRWSAEALACA